MSTTTLTRAETAPVTAASATSRTRVLAVGAVAGPLLFTLAWIDLGVLQPPTLTAFGVMGGIAGAISNPISGLGVGPVAAQFNVAFVVCGLLQAIGCVAAVEVLAA